MSYIKARDMEKIYRTGGSPFPALRGISFSMEKGSLSVILGPSGAGKTTLLNLLGGMDTLTSGRLTVDERSVDGLSPKELTLYRRSDVGFVFQFYNLMPNLTALENVELATEICSDAMDPHEALSLVGLSDFAGHFPGQLSGGQQQRVSIARAIAKDPKLLLCDEPTGALDSETGKSVLSLLSDLSRKKGRTVVIVTHNAEIRLIADHVLRLRNGQIISDEENPDPLPVDRIDW